MPLFDIKCFTDGSKTGTGPGIFGVVRSWLVLVVEFTTGKD